MKIPEVLSMLIVDVCEFIIAYHPEYDLFCQVYGFADSDFLTHLIFIHCNYDEFHDFCLESATFNVTFDSSIFGNSDVCERLAALANSIN